MRITPSSPRRLGLAVIVVTLICAGSAGAATEKILHAFNPYPHGLYPNPGLMADAAGNLYGTTSNGGTYLDGTVFKLTPNSHGGWTETVIYTFTGGTDGRAPQSGLVLDQSGNLYGTNAGGFGLVFKLTPKGNSWTFSVLYNFTGGADGGGPSGNLVLDGAGNLYGAALSGGNLSLCYSLGCGTIFKLTPSTGTWTLSVLYTFPGGSGGAYPNGSLIFDQAGNLYGTASGDDAKSCSSAQEGCGAVFELKPSGNSWTVSVLYSFTGLSDGDTPQGPLVIDQAGNLYGTATGGGVGSCRVQGCGLVFELKSSGGTWTKIPLYAFTGRTDGAYPKGGLVLDSAGNLYGAASAGGSPTCGTLFQLTPSSGGWTQSVLHSFKGSSDGCGPDGLIAGANGNIFGAAPKLGPGGDGVVFELTSVNGSWKESTASAFLGTDAAVPSNSGLILDSSGSLYGVTGLGGSAGQGAVFKVTPNSKGGWTESLLYSFKNSKNGDGPQGGLVFDAQGNLYGTASGGSTTSSCAPLLCGVVFKLTPSGGGWTQSVIHAFSGPDGNTPQGPLVVDAAGNLYGTTFVGGAFNSGTVFKLVLSSGGTWTETVLYNFTGGSDGSVPSGGLVFDQAGNLYGVTSEGGTGSGTVFQLAPSAGGTWTETVLHAFTNGLDGSSPQGPLALDAAGNLYGTTPNSSTGYGTVFQLSPSGGSWTLSVLLSLTGTEGRPGPVILDAAGNLYGTQGGIFDFGSGTVYQLTPGSSGWTETVLYTFTGYPLDGAGPTGSLTRDAASNLYGNTFEGGPANQGTVFEILP